MRAGQLRHNVTVQRPDPSSPRDSAGQRLTAWLDVAVNVPAKIEPLRGRDAFLAAQRQASTTHQVMMRFSPELAGVDGACRILFGARIFVFDGPPLNVDERNATLLIDCTEGLRTE